MDGVRRLKLLSSRDSRVPIPVTCRCGQSFAAGDHLAGRTVQCPKCKSPLTIPAPQAAAAPSPFSAPAAPPPSPFGGPGGGGSIFDDAGLRTFTAGKALCPSCNEDLPPNAVLCVKCGYNLQLGRKMTSHVKAAVATHGGHGDAAVALLQKAAKTIAEDKEAEKKALKEGMPWWMLGAIFIFALSTCITLLILPARQAIGYAADAVLFAMFIAIIYNMVLLVVIAFRHAPIHGFLLIVNPGYAPLYILARWEHTNHIFWGFVRTIIYGLIILVFLGCALGFALMTQPKEGAMLPLPEVLAMVSVNLARFV
jgi:hypothetical protein